MLDNLSDGVIVLGSDWHYRYVNEAAAEMLGRSSAELLGGHIWTEFPDVAGLPFHLAYEQAFEDGLPARIAGGGALRADPGDRHLDGRAGAFAGPVTSRPKVHHLAVSLRDAEARRKIVDTLEASADFAERIVFEITESAAVDHIEAACNFAEELTDLGCGLALDDFGVGFGSFTYLRKVPLRYLKIDRSFVGKLARSQDDERIVRSIISIADQFGLRTIAEGVEDEETLSRLRELGAHDVQGYHLGDPVPLSSVVASPPS